MIMMVCMIERMAILAIALSIIPIASQADETRTNCSIFSSYISCDDGTDYNLHGDNLWGPNGESYTLSKDPIGTTMHDPESIDGDYTTDDGTRIHVNGGMARVEYSQRALQERREQEHRREEQQKAFDDLLGKNDPVTVDADGFFE